MEIHLGSNECIAAPLVELRYSAATDFLSSVLFFCLILIAHEASAQENDEYTRQRFVSVYAEYSNIAGLARGRKLFEAGADFDFRIFKRVRSANVYYEVAVKPVTFIGDPFATATLTFTGGPSYTDSNPPQVIMCKESFIADRFFSVTERCNTRWTYGGGFSPVGFHFDFLRTHRIQPMLRVAGGLVFTTRDVPIYDSKALNYMGELGAGFEVFRPKGRSLEFEYRFYHLSNGYTGDYNPGIEGQIVRVSYAFGK